MPTRGGLGTAGCEGCGGAARSCLLPFPSPSPRALIKNKVRSEWSGVKDAGGAGTVDARLALGAGEQPSSHRDRPDRPGTQGGVIFSGRQHRGSCRAGAGAVRATLHITPLVAGAESILHDSPGTEQSPVFARGFVGRGGRTFRSDIIWLLGWRNGAQGVAGGSSGVAVWGGVAQRGVEPAQRPD